MKALNIWLIFLLIFLALHCYALHKQVAYYRGELHSVIRDFKKFLQADTERIEKEIYKTNKGGQ